MNPPLAEHPVFAPDILRGFHLLEADAGTGKTWTISGLVVRALVERGLDIDSVLVVSFTRAATAELSQRIRDRIEQVAQAIAHRLGAPVGAPTDPFCLQYAATVGDPQLALRRLGVALARIDEAQVRTIHGFCHRVITEHAMSIGLDRGLRAEALGTQWIERGLAAWWRESIAALPTDALALLHACGVSPASLTAPVRVIDARPRAKVVPPASDWRDLPREISHWRELLGTALAAEARAFEQWAGVKGNANGTRMRADHLRTRLAALERFASASPEECARIPEAVAKFTAAYAGSDGKYPVPAFELVAVCEQLDALRLRASRVPAEVAHEAASELARRRLELKLDQGAIDHDDLLRIVRDALAQPGTGATLAASLRERYPVALVDECQDTDALQWEIFSAVYRAGAPASPGSGDPRAVGQGGAPGATHHALVLVGDPKQSIYAFRSADVYSYLEARRADPSCHALHENQRSVPALLHALNALFERPQPFLVPQIGFSPARAGARPRAPFRDRMQAERGAITVFEVVGEAEGGDREGAMIARRDGVRAALRCTVGEIARMLATGEASLGDRALAPGDIAVLVNSHHEGALVKSALQAAGIAAAEISRDSVLESRECAELARVIAAIATPADAGLVRGALATMLVDRLDLGADAAAAPWLLGLLAGARATWSSSGPHAALLSLFTALDAYRRLATVRDGERRLTNLAHLIELLANAREAREGAAPALRWLVRMRDNPEDLGAEATELRLESDENLVRIATVHKSKGLEYPVVFLPFAWSGREFARRRDRGRAGGRAAATAIHYHEAIAGEDIAGEGIAGEGRAGEGSAGEGSAGEGSAGEETASGAFEGAGERSGHWRAVVDFDAQKGSTQWAQASTEAYSETLRALYVGLTRAQQRCYLVWGAVSSAQFAPLSWLLAGLDPREQSAWRAGGKNAPALTEPLAGDSLRGWLSRANERAADAVRVIASTWRHAGAAARAAAPFADATPPSSTAGARPAPASLNARAVSGRVPAAWIQTSFTALARAVAEHGGDGGVVLRAVPELPDHDQAVAAGDAPVAGEELRFAFASGALAGTCLHDILERADFSRPIDEALVANALERVGYRNLDASGVARWLDRVVATPLPCREGEPAALARIEPSALVREMEFHLAARDVDTREVIDAVASEYPLDARVASHRWSGFLRGFIDLVYPVRGQWYLLDWKSNRLGPRVENYDEPAMLRANAANAYPLQFCLYALALHRLLRARLAGYAYDTHFGGVRYLYLRAVGATPCHAEHPGYGVYATRPSEALIDELDRLFEGRR